MASVECHYPLISLQIKFRARRDNKRRRSIKECRRFVFDGLVIPCLVRSRRDARHRVPPKPLQFY